MLSFDDYGEIGARLDDVLAGRRRPAHVARTAAACCPSPRPNASPSSVRLRWRIPPRPGRVPAAACSGGGCLGGVVAPLKIASGCDRRCSFCAIPSFRGAFVSRRPPES